MRIVTAYLLLLHSTVKLFDFPVTMGSGSSGDLMLMAGILEIVGGILLILGLLTRPAVFTLSGQMTAAYLVMHATKGSTLFPFVSGDESAVLFCFMFSYLIATGGGSLALDNLLGKNKT